MKKFGGGRNQQQRKNRGGGGKFERMLDMGRLAYFTYDVKEVFRRFEIKDVVYIPILSSIVAKASRIGISAAEEFLMQKVTDGILPKDIEAPLVDLIRRYSRMR